MRRFHLKNPSLRHSWGKLLGRSVEDPELHGADVVGTPNSDPQIVLMWGPMSLRWHDVPSAAPLSHCLISRVVTVAPFATY